jgi:hypothetical protein
MFATGYTSGHTNGNGDRLAVVVEEVPAAVVQVRVAVALLNSRAACLDSVVVFSQRH